MEEQVSIQNVDEETKPVVTPSGPAYTENHMLKAKLLVMKYFNDNVEKTDGFKLIEEQVYIVWWTYILGGWKALISTTITDGMYYEVTYDKAKRRTYIDAYKKFANITVED